MTYYIALIHKEPGSVCGVSFPDVPGVTTAADSIDEAMERAVEVLALDWRDLRHEDFPCARTIDELRNDPTLAEDLADAIIAAVPVRALADAA